MSVSFEEVETGLSALRSELDRAAKDKSKRALRPRKGFAAHLERIEEVIEPEIPADCKGLEKDLIGGDRSERRDVVPPKFRVLVTRGPKIRFPRQRRRGSGTGAGTPYRERTAVYRQEAIYLRDGVEDAHALEVQA